MTTDDQSSTSSDDLIREAREAVQQDPVMPPAPDAMGSAPEAADQAQVPAGFAEMPPAPSAPEIAMPDAPANYRRGLIFAVAAAAAGAAVWAFILAYAEIQSWLLGIGIGYLIGLAAIRGAGVVSSQLRVAAILLTFAAVIVGEVLGTALLINKDFGIFDLDLARRLYFDNLGRDFGFALVSAAAGSLAVFSATKK